MKRIWIALAVIALAAVVAACGSSVPESSLTLRNATTNALVSTSKTTGSITINVGDEYPLQVIRTFRNDTGQTDNADVTQFTNFKWVSGAGVATVDAFGNITGVAAGVANLEAKFRESSLDPWDIVRLQVNVN